MRFGDTTDSFGSFGGHGNGVVRIYHSFARSGGTLVNKFLGVHNECLVLSEVNPAVSYKPLGEQAVEWLGLIEAHEQNRFLRLAYAEQVSLLYARARDAGKHLVVRDWVTVNFLPNTAQFHGRPSGVLEQTAYLRNAGFETLSVVVARRAVAVYKSIVDNFVQFENLTIDDFANAYLAYAQAVSTLPVFQLEHISRRPEQEIPRIISALNLPATDINDVLQRFSNFDKCTGDNTLARQLDNTKSGQNILVHPVEAEELSADSRLQQADRLLGYDK